MYLIGLREYNQNEQLWNLCERLVADIPREGERAFYFIQGHLEQLGCSRKQEFHPGSAHFNLPSQILCRVINIQILVEPSTNEIYFRITLLPDIDTDRTVPDPTPPKIRKHEMYSFWKILMASITSAHGVSDRQRSPIPSSVIPSQSHIGVLATVSHAVMSGTMFVVYQKQRASQFVIRLNKYLEAMDNDIYVGMRFKMGFQREDSLDEISCFGTFVDVGDFSPEWPGSKWRSLQVQWDEPATTPRPENISPWEIEPIATFNSKSFKPYHNLSSGSTSNSPTSIFLSKPETEKASTLALRSFCNWFCCCFK
ncbi:hypothetical protein QN277_022882 [Acacia crassicarpa]|uniref:Auxin response factor domain-containing protein n=1 Tax=Acacia crassicarpa TaxID=499986 RepID=A0AAE1MLG3_9FABA|nr:hypothetical protein QN277_022882 [Acacia crassicarpa]